MRFDACGWAVDADSRLVELAAARVELSGFQSDDPPKLRLRWVEVLSGAAAKLDGVRAGFGTFAVHGDELLVSGLRDAWGAEAALKLAFQVSVLRQGGLLLHAASVRFEGGLGVAVLGESGAGKSTLARLCRAAGAELLTDETTAVLRGELHGTPFKSDDDLPGQRLHATAAALLTLEKGTHEAFEPLPPFEGTRALLGQPYRPPEGELGGAELLARAAALAEVPGVTRFTFRKDPAAASALRRWLIDRSRPA